jgi:hypothetical protein
MVFGKDAILIDGDAMVFSKDGMTLWWRCYGLW